MIEQTLKNKEKQLNLLIALDKARDSLDSLSDPTLMFKQIARTLRQFYAADAAALLLINVETQNPEVTIGVGMPQNMVLELGREAMQFKKPQVINSTAWKYTIALRIFIERENRVPGSIILARDSQPFTQTEVELLELAETQIDSAVTQARTMYRLAVRNRELEAIYRIDRLRDDASDEDTLYANFASLLMQHFDAQFCQFIVADMSTGELITRKKLDTQNIPVEVVDQFIEETRDIQTTTVIKSPDALPDFKVMASPLIVSGSRLGTVIIGREEDFNIGDTRLMVALTSQMDSAIAKSRTNLQLAQRNRELETIYRIDKIRDLDTDLEEMLEHVLEELCKAISSETGFLLLLNPDEQALEIKATTHEMLINDPRYKDVILQVSQEARDSEGIISNNYLGEPVNSILATPLILNEKIIGVVGAINSTDVRGFTEHDGRMLRAITSQVDTAVFERLERRRMRRVLQRSVDPKVMEHLLTRADDSILAGERKILSVLFADLRGSTEWAERTAPEELVHLLNQFLERMTNVIFEFNGTLDKFVGDEVIALFGTPLPMEDHAMQAALAGLKMQAEHAKLRLEVQRLGQEIPPMGVGISTGELIAGEFGPPMRTDFTAMGRVMNLGARICSAAKANQVIISETTYKAIDAHAQVNVLDPITPKGIQTPVQVYELLKITP